MANNSNNNMVGMKEVLVFVGFICLIFSFLVSNEISSPDLFLKILNIVLLVVLTAIGFICTIKSIADSLKANSRALVVLNGALILIYLTLIIKVIYSV